MAYLADWVLETASNPGTNATVNLAGAVTGPFKSFASAFSSGDSVFYTISDETAARETGIGTFIAGAPNTITRNTVKANTLGTTNRVNFIGAVFVWCSPPASNAAYYDTNGNLQAPGSVMLNNNNAIVTRDSGGSTVNALRMTASNIMLLLTGTGGLQIADQSSSVFWSINSAGVVNQTGDRWSVDTNPDSVSCVSINEVAGVASTALVTNLNLTTSVHAAFLLNSVVKGSISQVSTTGVAFNTTSDQTLKINDGEIPASDAGDIIDKLKPRWFRWKSDPDGPSEPGFFAQEVHRIFSWAVTIGRGRKGSKGYMPWQMDQAKLMPVVVAEIKALRARVAELELLHGGP